MPATNRKPGRPPRHGERMIQKTVRLPAAWILRLIAEFGSFQNAIETLAKRHLDKPD